MSPDIAAGVRTTCPYCGVGCGVETRGGARLGGDVAHPANGGRLCVKGSALGETLGLGTRLLEARIAGRPVPLHRALDRVAERLARTVADHGPSAAACYLSGQLLTEDYYVANKLMKGFLGSPHVDTNSRLCMASAVAAHERAFGEDLVPGCFDDAERADLVVMVGWNAAWTHPVLFQRIVAARQAEPEKRIVVIDPRRTVTADAADLHLPLRPGTDALLFNALLAALAKDDALDLDFIRDHTAGFDAALAHARADAPDPHAAASACGLATDKVEQFFRWFRERPRTVSFFSQGVNQSGSGTDKAGAIINCHLATGRIGKPGACPFSITGQPNAMGGREVGGLANQLAAHMTAEVPADRERVRRFWNAPAMVARSGYKAVDLFEAVERGEIRFLWIMATNPLVSLPDAARWRAALARCETVVVSDCVAETDTTAVADILLPASAWGEKDGTVTNSERVISRQRAFLPRPGDAQPDWLLVCEVARRLGFGTDFDYAGPFEIFREHARLSAFENDGRRVFDLSALAGLDRAGYDALAPIRWPVTNATPGGTARLFADGRFPTPDGRARFVALRARPPRAAPGPKAPFVLNTGRVRDQWHSMTRTSLAECLGTHTPEPFAALHPGTLERLGVTPGELVRVSNEHGELLLRARADAGVAPTDVFVPMHWSGQFASAATVDTLVPPVTDPISGQPEFKHAAVAVHPFPAAWYALIVSRRALPTDLARYWSRMPVARGWVHWLAGGTNDDIEARLRRTLGSDPMLSFSNAASGERRWALFDDQRLSAVCFSGPTPVLPTPWWFAARLGERLTEAERAAVLSGADRAGGDAGAIVCSCRNVGERSIGAAIAEGCTSVESLGERLGCGTSCGSCVPELRALLAAVGQESPEGARA